jgi:putative FmdB family regulatory protein
MPVYTYRCGNCGVQFERQQSFTDQPLKSCPECRKKALKKVITSTKVIFKGSGFYATDNRSPSGDSSAKKSEKSEEKPKPEKKETKTESKASGESSSE